MSKERAALVIANTHYEDEQLHQLVAPAQDAEALTRVLADSTIGGFEVQSLVNEASYKANQAIERFFDRRQRDDLLLLYFSGHGIKDEVGQLFFATPDTRRRRLRTTAIPAALVNDVMRYSRSRQQVLILDCCFSGAFAKGMIAKAENNVGAAVGTGEQLGSRGRVVLTASDAMQYAFEGNKIEGTGVQSVFTKHLVRALESGEADLAGDGLITFDELYDYVHDHVVEETPKQRPEKWDFGVQGKIIIARNPNPPPKEPVELPAELQQAIDSPLAGVREGAVSELGRLLRGSDAELASVAEDTLKQLADDDSRRVSAAAARQLEAQMEAQQEAQLDSQPEAQQEAQLDSQLEAKQEAQLDSQLEAQQEAQAVVQLSPTQLPHESITSYRPPVERVEEVITVSPAPSEETSQVVVDQQTPFLQRWWRPAAGFLAMGLIVSYLLDTSSSLPLLVTGFIFGVIGLDHARQRRWVRAGLFVVVGSAWLLVAVLGVSSQ